MRALMAQSKIHVAAGASYHFPEPGWLRMTFSLERVVIRVALGRMERMFGWQRWAGLERSEERGSPMV